MRTDRSIVLADSHAILIEGLAAVLSRAGYDVVATVHDLHALEPAITLHEPGLCLLESHFDDGDGIEAIPGLTESSPLTRAVVLTADSASDTLHRALEAGASGYVHKTRTSDVLIDVLARVARGQVAIEGSFTRPSTTVTRLERHTQRLAGYLTPREKQCLVLMSDGLDTTAMAGHLGVSITTVRTHVAAVLSKLGVHSRLEAVSLATRYKLLDRVS